VVCLRRRRTGRGGEAANRTSDKQCETKQQPRQSEYRKLGGSIGSLAVSTGGKFAQHLITSRRGFERTLNLIERVLMWTLTSSAGIYRCRRDVSESERKYMDLKRNVGEDRLSAHRPAPVRECGQDVIWNTAPSPYQRICDTGSTKSGRRKAPFCRTNNRLDRLYRCRSRSGLRPMERVWSGTLGAPG